jgi:transketolase
VWGLNKLVALYDDNGISIDGPVEGWFRDDTPARFAAYGWQVLGPIDGHDVAAVGNALAAGPRQRDKPTLIVCRTTIGQGSPGRAGTAKAHGEPLGADEIAKTRAAIGWPHAPFEIPAEVRSVSGTPPRPVPRTKPPGRPVLRPTARPSRPKRPNSSAACGRPAGGL